MVVLFLRCLSFFSIFAEKKNVFPRMFDYTKVNSIIFLVWYSSICILMFSMETKYANFTAS